MANNLDFTTSNNGGHVVNTNKDGSDVKVPNPTPKVDEKRGFAKASPTVPQYSPKSVADKDKEKVLAENEVKNETPVKINPKNQKVETSDQDKKI